MTSFYVFCPEQDQLFGVRWAYGAIVKPDLTGDAERCPVCGAAISMLKWLPPHRLRLSSAKSEKWSDFVWGAGFSLVVSARLKAIYENEKLCGIQQFYPPAMIVRMGKHKAGDFSTPLPTYHLVEIERLGPELDEEASGVVRKSLDCPHCHRGLLEKWDRVVIKPDTWKGEDIFYPRGLPGTCVVSERFKEVVETYRLTNAWLIPAEKWAYDQHRPQWPTHYAQEE